MLPIVIWIMRDQFMSIPTELEEAAMVDGQGVWGAFFSIILPIALPGMVAAFVLSLVLTWNEYFFASLLTSTNTITLPVMVASQTGSQGISWWTMAAISFAAILPLIVVGHPARALHHQGHVGRLREVAAARRPRRPGRSGLTPPGARSLHVRVTSPHRLCRLGESLAQLEHEHLEDEEHGPFEE